MVAGGPARWVLENPAMLEGPRADRHASDKPGFLVPWGAPQRLAERNSPCVGTDRLAPPPARQMDPVSLGRRSIPPPLEMTRINKHSTGNGLRRLEKPARAQTTALTLLGKTGTRGRRNFPTHGAASSAISGSWRPVPALNQPRILRLKLMAAVDLEMMPWR